MPNSIEDHLPPRYRLLRPIGSGGMGTVYLVRDRLRARNVALKHMHEAYVLDDMDTDQGTYLRVALTREFRMLASLRHPNIVSVLDYGFDSEGLPFFTMEWLQDSQTLVEAIRQLAYREQINLFVQLLRALFYVHRRGMVHRDIKPNNIHVVRQGNGYQLKLLDFGLSVSVGQDADTSGTVFYLAPEVMTQTKVTSASDLYSTGVVFYQALAGEFPYPSKSISQYVAHVLNDPPMLPFPSVPPELETFLQNLLSKKPEHRFSDAREAILALNTASNHSFPVETIATRDSFIQSAAFVGRDAEVSMLREQLHNAIYKQGCSWLIGGESGVGKSRLLDEIRIEALTAGAEVVVNRAQQDGETTYGVWLGVIMPLLMSRELPEEELAILNMLGVDLAQLLEREIPPVPEQEAATVHKQMTEIMARLITQHHKPLLVILEDLHWASDESVMLLDHITRLLDASRVMLVGTFRDDEAPSIPERLAAMRVLPLERLNEAAVGQLVVSMLGDIESRGDLVTVLQSETRGNAFFLVEIMRSLAEQAGELEAVTSVDQMEMPDRIRQTLENRFRRLSAGAQTLLEIAALAGQEIDLRLLRLLAPEDDIEMFLQEGAEYHVTEWRHGRWRFTHNKLREQVINDLAAPQKVILHRYIAEGLEQVYHDDSLDGKMLLPAIASNWEQADEPFRAVPILIIMAQDALRLSALDEALAAVDRVIACDNGATLPEKVARQIMDAYYMRFYAYRQNEQRDYLISTYMDALDLAKRSNLPDLFLRAYQLGADAGALTYAPKLTQECARKMLEYAAPASGEAYLAYYRLSQGYRIQRLFAQAIEVADQALELVLKREPFQTWHGWEFETSLYTYFALTTFFESVEAVIWSFSTSLAYCHTMQGDYDQAEPHLRRALQATVDMPHSSRYSISIHNLTLCLQGHGNIAEAHEMALQLQSLAPQFFPALSHTADFLVKICLARRELRNKDAAYSLYELAQTNFDEQEVEDGIICARDARDLFRQLGDSEGEANAISLLRRMNDPLL